MIIPGIPGPRVLLPWREGTFLTEYPRNLRMNLRKGGDAMRGRLGGDGVAALLLGAVEGGVGCGYHVFGALAGMHVGHAY